MNSKIILFVITLFVKQIFSFAQYTKLFDLDNTSTGFSPYHVALISDGTWLYGTGSNGGENGGGSVYKIKPDGTDFTKILDFDEVVTGQVPQSGVILIDDYLYGNAASGGEFGFGTLYKVKTDGTAFEKLRDFPGAEGGVAPRGALYFDGTYLYGITTQGGLEGAGTIYKVKPDGTDFSIIFHFELLATGNGPFGGVISDGTYLYGMTVGGGDGFLGTVYKLKPDGTDFSKLVDFIDDPNGAWGYGSLVFDGTYLYGMTNNGGVDNRGTIFKVKTDGAEYQKLFDFDDDNGAQPLGSLILQGTTLYGMAELGGDDFEGTLFQINTDGSDFTLLFEFDGINSGGIPYGTLFFENGALFGVTNGCGANNHGVIFRYGDIMESIEDAALSQLKIYPNPAQNSFNIELDEKLFSGNSELEISNLQGEIMYTTSIYSAYTEVKLINFANGMYIVKVRDGEHNYISQLIVQGK